MSRRKASSADEDRAHRVPPQGPAVFPPSRTKNPPLIGGIRNLDDQPVCLRVRWPGATARAQTGVFEVIAPEVVRMSEKLPVRVTMRDPYA